MFLQEFIKIMKDCGIEHSIAKTGRPDWIRVFIKLNGVTYGRMSFNRGKQYLMHWYKPQGYRDFDEGDFLVAKVNAALYGVKLPESIMKDFVKESIDECAKDLRYKIAWRKANPLLDKDGHMKSRRKLEGKNPRPLFFQKCHDYAVAHVVP